MHLCNHLSTSLTVACDLVLIIGIGCHFRVSCTFYKILFWLCKRYRDSPGFKKVSCHVVRGLLWRAPLGIVGSFSKQPVSLEIRFWSYVCKKMNSPDHLSITGILFSMKTPKVHSSRCLNCYLHRP